MVLLPIKKSSLNKKSSGGFVSSALYRWLITSPLTGPVTSGRASKTIPNMWPGNPERGSEIMDGMFEHLGEAHRVAIASALPEQASRKWLKWFHSFAWLSDLKALGGIDAAGFAAMRTSEWIEANKNWNEHSWDKSVTATRISNWMINWDFICGEGSENSESPKNSGPEFKKRAVKSLIRDTRHIMKSAASAKVMKNAASAKVMKSVKSAASAKAGFQHLHALKGFVIAAHALFAKPRLKSESMKYFEAAVANQILPDGGHVERNPQVLALVLNDLIEIKNMLAALGSDVPGWIQNAIDRAAPMLRMLRHPDGGLALFNGAGVGDNGFLDQLLLQSGSTANTPNSAPHTGFQRLSSGATHIIMDAGIPGDFGGADVNHHAGTLSFEMSTNNQRMIVNCGDREDDGGPWRRALSASAAHSTMIVNDTSSSAERGGGGKRRGPLNVTCKRGELEDEGIVVETSHDGYANIFGLVHQRTLFLSPGGGDVRGEDRLVGTGGEQFTIRFHLHPRAHASLLSGGGGVLIKLGKKELWRFHSSTGEITLEESIYAGRLGLPKHTEQIVITGPLSGNGALVKWAFSRETA